MIVAALIPPRMTQSTVAKLARRGIAVITWLRQLVCDHNFSHWERGTHSKYGECLVRRCLNCEKIEPKPQYQSRRRSKSRAD